MSTEPKTTIETTELARQTGEEFRVVDLTLSSDGSLYTHTQDTGPTAKLLYNREDYEFWLTIPPDAVGKLAFALLKDKFLGNAGASDELREFCKSNEIPHEFSVW